MFFFFIYLKMNLEVYCNNYVCLFVNLSFFRVYVKIYVGVFKLMKLLKKIIVICLCYELSIYIRKVIVFLRIVFMIDLVLNICRMKRLF